MKVRIDQDLCTGCGTCVEIAPDLFEMQGDVAVEKMQDVPNDQQEACREASEACPVDAIPIGD